MEDMDLKQERIWTSAWQYGIIALDVYILPVRMPDTLYYALILVGGYAVSLPAAFRICKGMPPMPFCKELPRARTFVRWAVIGFALMWIGSLIGNAVTDLVGLATGRAPAPIVDDMVNAMPLAVNIVCVCLLGPLCEELLFRGLVAGRLARYGQAPGAFVSALLFALYHANLEQFFYAFLLGLLLAYVYYRTGLLRVSVALHMVLNFSGRSCRCCCLTARRPTWRSARSGWRRSFWALSCSCAAAKTRSGCTVRARRICAPCSATPA